MSLFTQFSHQFYQQAAARGYRLNGPNLTDAAHWTMTHIESASLAVVHVLDAARCDISPMLAEGGEPRHDNLLERFHNVIFIYLLVTDGEMPPLWPAATEPYYGQPVYRVFWQLDAQTGQIILPEGQPAELFGLRGLAENALLSAANGDAVTFAEVTDNIMKNAVTPKYPAIFPWILLSVNAIILTLMYLDGYAHDPMTAMRFGAIVPERVFNNGEYYRLFTAMFVHFGLRHLLMNMVGLLIFGTRVERYLGPGYFAVIYFLSGLCGSAASLIFTRGYAAGASGAIYGLVGAVFAFTRITKQPMDQLSDYIMLIYILVGVAMGFATPHVDNFAHIGGLLAGLGLGAAATKLVVKNKDKGV